MKSEECDVIHKGKNSIIFSDNSGFSNVSNLVYYVHDLI